MNKEIFVSIDIETFGPIPGINAMVELGAAAYQIDGTVIATWQVTLAEPPESVRDSATMKWWFMPEQFPTYEKLVSGPKVAPSKAMCDFNLWVQDLGGRPTPVCYPAGFDYMFVYWYLMRYIGHSTPFSFSCIDLKTYVMAARKEPSYIKTAKNKFPKAWFHKGLPHTHNALDDALGQGWMFIQAYRSNLGMDLLDENDLKLP